MNRGIHRKLTYEDRFARFRYCNAFRFLPAMKRRNRRKLRRLGKGEKREVPLAPSGNHPTD